MFFDKISKFAEFIGYYNFIMHLYIFFVLLGISIALVLILKRLSEK